MNVKHFSELNMSSRLKRGRLDLERRVPCIHCQCDVRPRQEALHVMDVTEGNRERVKQVIVSNTYRILHGICIYHKYMLVTEGLVCS